MHVGLHCLTRLPAVDDNDVASLNFRDAVTLLTERFNRDLTDVSLPTGGPC